jgi:hypothetical protein
MGGGATWTALQSQKATCVSGGGTGTRIELETQHEIDYDNDNKGGRGPRQGGLPRGWKIRKEGQDKEERLASVEEVHSAAVQVEGGNAAFLLMA